MRLEDGIPEEKGQDMERQRSLKERSQEQDVEGQKSLKERSEEQYIKRRQEVRSKLILLNSAIALIVIMSVLIFKVVSMNQDNSPKVKSASTTESDKSIKDKDNNEKEDDKAEVSSTPVPTATPAAGADRWLRKDLDKNKPMVALTFDDGPYTPVTKKILATLEKHDQRATFFWVCNRIPRYESSVEQAYSQGCQIASHTFGHVILTKLKKKKSILDQINKANRQVNKVIGCDTTALRPPGGAVNSKVKKTVKVPMICWNVDSEDWKSRNTKKILQRCKSISDGDIILMHDLYPTTAKAVEKLVPQLKKKGFQMVTIDELFYYKGIQLKPGHVYFSGK